MSEDDWPDIRANDREEQLRYLWRIRGAYSSQCAEIGEEELSRLVRDGLAQCNLLEIKDPQEVMRFLALSFLLTREQRASSFLMRVYQLVIQNADVSARRRLNFLFRHLIGREPPMREPDFGPWFIEPG